MHATNSRLSDEEFFALRQEVLKSWPTGSYVDLEDGFAFQASLPAEKRLTRLFDAAAAAGYPLLNPYGGLAPVDAYLDLLLGLEDDGTVDFLPMSIDSRTRTNEYAAADAGVRESIELGRSMLNGFPIVHYGVEGCRQVTSTVTKPVISRLSAVDARLVAEVSFAGGCTGLTGSPMASFTCYSRNHPPETVIRNWQYVERLVATYAEAGFAILRDHPQYNIGAAHPPALSIVLAIMNALIAAGQGAPYVAPAHQQQGSVLQTIAAMHVERKLVREYLDLLGFAETKTHSILVTWVGAFPPDPYRAVGVLSMGAVIACLGGAQNLVCKSADEGIGLARPSVNRESMRTVRQIIDMLHYQRFPADTPELRDEIALIESEVRALIDAVLELGKGDPVTGFCAAIGRGVVDLPYAPNQRIAGNVTCAYDRTGAVRYVEFGQLPLPEWTKQVHREKLAERAQGRPLDDLAIEDVLSGIALPAAEKSSAVTL